MTRVLISVHESKLNSELKIIMLILTEVMQNEKCNDFFWYARNQTKIVIDLYLAQNNTE